MYAPGAAPSKTKATETELIAVEIRLSSCRASEVEVESDGLWLGPGSRITSAFFTVRLFCLGEDLLNSQGGFYKLI